MERRKNNLNIVKKQKPPKKYNKNLRFEVPHMQKPRHIHLKKSTI
jgi:hypothetical protein